MFFGEPVKCQKILEVILFMLNMCHNALAQRPRPADAVRAGWAGLFGRAGGRPIAQSY
jgi:hypothetical protein